MSAKEMFEALGYELIQDSIDWLTYSANYEKWYEHNIDFNKKEKQIRISGGIVAMGRIITLDELKAINQQCKELGWLDE
jgi:hypothetical protein